MNQKPKINFKNWKCFISLGYYNAGSRLAIQLLSDEEDADKGVFYGEPIAVATVNIPELQLKDNEICIKNYSENEGMIDTLQKAGLITEVKREVSTGFVTVHIVEKTNKLIELEKELKTTNKSKPKK